MTHHMVRHDAPSVHSHMYCASWRTMVRHDAPSADWHNMVMYGPSWRTLVRHDAPRVNSQQRTLCVMTHLGLRHDAPSVQSQHSDVRWVRKLWVRLERIFSDFELRFSLSSTTENRLDLEWFRGRFEQVIWEIQSWRRLELRWRFPIGRNRGEHQ